MAVPRIFVSHSHHDNAFCRDYVNGLREHGLDVWYDEHSLGWGALRSTVEHEMPLCQHFVAILSPAAVASEWVNTEIDAALELIKDGTLQTLTFVVVTHCTVPLLLRRWKRIESTSGTPLSVAEAVARTAAVVAPPLVVSADQTPSPLSPPHPSAIPPSYQMSRDRFPERLEQLGFVPQQFNGVEYILPPLCDVPAGPFFMGSDKRRDLQTGESELPRHTVTLSAYQIARYPVTVAEYACFVRAGHTEPAPHKDMPSWMAQSTSDKQLPWEDQLAEHLDHPVVNVSWHDSVAYAMWLAVLTGQPWRLTTESEWEKAARGRDGNIYPWGDTRDMARANTYEGGKGTTTPVGTYPSGVNAYGAYDMAGNVWEWTGSLFASYPYDPTDGRENLTSDDSRVLRGGSWSSHIRNARAASRHSAHPGYFDLNIGFRLCRSVPVT